MGSQTQAAAHWPGAGTSSRGAGPEQVEGPGLAGVGDWADEASHRQGSSLSAGACRFSCSHHQRAVRGGAPTGPKRRGWSVDRKDAHLHASVAVSNTSPAGGPWHLIVFRPACRDLGASADISTPPTDQARGGPPLRREEGARVCSPAALGHG